MTAMDYRTRWLLAAHEAGHALTAVHCGLAVHYATLTEGNGFGGTLTEDAADPWLNAVVCAGGMAAVPGTRASHDEQAITELVGGHRIAEAVKAARAVIYAHRQAMRALTFALRDRGYLSGADIAALVGGHGGKARPPTNKGPG